MGGASICMDSNQIQKESIPSKAATVEITLWPFWICTPYALVVNSRSHLELWHSFMLYRAFWTNFKDYRILTIPKSKDVYRCAKYSTHQISNEKGDSHCNSKFIIDTQNSNWQWWYPKEVDHINDHWNSGRLLFVLLWVFKVS